MHGNKLVQHLMMKKLMTYMMLSCRKATELIEKKVSFSLSPIEKMQLFLHTSMCHACRTYEKQSKFLDKCLCHFYNPTVYHPEMTNPTQASDDFKDMIISDLENK